MIMSPRGEAVPKILCYLQKVVHYFTLPRERLIRSLGVECYLLLTCYCR